MGALASAVHSGKALYAGISNYNPEQTRAAAAALAEHKVPLLIHQPRYNMFDRHIEPGLFRCWMSWASAASCSRRWRRACSPTAT